MTVVAFGDVSVTNIILIKLFFFPLLSFFLTFVPHVFKKKKKKFIERTMDDNFQLVSKQVFTYFPTPRPESAYTAIILI